MTDDSHIRLTRRLVLSLAAATTVGSLASAADHTPNTLAESDAEKGPGVPIPTSVVMTTGGRVRGLIIDGVQSFKGLRYGAPPIGELRWMPPQPAQPWQDVYDASDFGAPAMQLVSGGHDAADDFEFQMHRVYTMASDVKVMSEDCLYLNVWTPGTNHQKRPVMVWIHGGGFTSGSSSMPPYHGDGLAKTGNVVVVSINHRLNVFGYLHLGEAMGFQFASSGTLGMQDLVLALQWVRDNAEAFGGDPGNVMIMGQSGGGAKVCALLSMPSAKGLFHKAAIQSGPGMTVGRKAQAAEASSLLLSALNVKPGDVAALQALPAQSILAAAAKVPGVGSGPILDEVAITRDPFTPDAPDVSAEVPIIIGWCKDEWTITSASQPWFGQLTDAELEDRVSPHGDSAEKLLAVYRKTYPNYSPTYLWVQMMSGRMMLGSETIASRKAAKAAAPAYVYMVTWETPVAGGKYKSPHTIEIPFMLYSYDRVRQFVGPGSEPKRMAAQIGGAWVAFARTGKPDHAGIPHWPEFNANERPVMVFNSISKVINDPLAPVRQALEALPAATNLMGL